MKARIAALLDTLLLGLAAVSVAGLLGLRLYAALATVPVESPWDDRHFRLEALQDADETSFPRAIARVLLPNNRSFYTRTVGYNEVLVAGLETARLAGLEDAELGMQLTNSVLLLVQLAALFLLARWATASTSFALALSFLYLSTPIIFGLNRWILTENHVAPGLLVGSMATCWLLTRQPALEGRASQLWAAVLAGYLTGVFATLREYAAPALAAIALCAFAGLLFERRRREALAYSVAFVPFALASAGNAFSSLSHVLGRIANVFRYFHPGETWVSYLFFHGMGPPMAVLLASGVLAAFYLGARDLRPRKIVRPGQAVLLVGYLLVTAFYTYQVATTHVRLVRPLLVPMLLAVVLLLIVARVLPSFRSLIRGPGAAALLAILILGTWGHLTHQLFFAFDGGESFIHGPNGPEINNYPLGLRPLLDAEDSHASTLWVARERVWKRAEDGIRADMAEILESSTPEKRRRLMDRILEEPYLQRAWLANGELTLAAVRSDRWTFGASSAAVIASNPSERSRVARVGIGVWARQGADYPISVFVENGKAVKEYEFVRGGTRTVRLGKVPPGGRRLFLVWSSKAWLEREGDRLLGVRLRAPAER